MRRYLRTLAIGTALLTGGAAAFNWAVDPYGVFAMPEVTGFNAIKPRAGQRGWLAKVHRIEQHRPRALILGNSRAEVGFDPTHEAWPAAVRPVVNAALPGTGPATARDLLELAARFERPQLVVLGLDFLDFRTARDARPDAPEPAADPLAPLNRLRNVRDTTFSTSTLRDAIATIAAQRDPYARDLTRLGFNPMRDHLGLAIAEGYAALFVQKDRENARNLLRGPKEIFVASARTSDALESTRAILRIAEKQGTDLRFVIYPYHARLLELFHHAGLWPAFEAWKAALVELIDAERARSPHLRVTLWDFSGYDERTWEPVPDGRGRDVTMQWYWEAGHFKKALGDRVLARVLQTPEALVPAAPSDGVVLTAANLPAALAHIRSGRERYLQARPAEAAAIRDLAQRMRPADGST